MKLPVSQSADLSTPHKSLDIAVVDLGLNMYVREHLGLDLQILNLNSPLLKSLILCTFILLIDVGIQLKVSVVVDKTHMYNNIIYMC